MFRPSAPDPCMPTRTLLALPAAALVLAACQQQEPGTAGPAVADTVETAPGPKKPAEASPERIREIEASGLEGLWSNAPELCKGAKPRVVTLAWNVKASGAKRVVLYIVDKNGVDKNFAQGGPVGERDTGPWVRAGSQFKLKDKASKQYVAELVIGEKRDC